MDRAIIEGSSIDGMSEAGSDRAWESSSPGDCHHNFGHSTPACTTVKDIWLGKKYLEYFVALQLHLRADPEDEVPVLEVSSHHYSVSVTRGTRLQSYRDTNVQISQN